MFKTLHPSLRNAMYMVLLTFIVLVSATAYTLKLTFQNFEPVIDKNYYEIGLNYEKAIQEQKELIANGYQLKLSVGSGAQILNIGKQIAEVTLTENGKPRIAKSVILILERSATARNSRTFRLTENKNGKYAGEILIPAPGTWNTRVLADISGKKMELQGLVSAR